jgi:hypothetical protein
VPVLYHPVKVFVQADFSTTVALCYVLTQSVSNFRPRIVLAGWQLENEPRKNVRDASDDNPDDGYIPFACFILASEQAT